MKGLSYYLIFFLVIFVNGTSTLMLENDHISVTGHKLNMEIKHQI